MSDDFIGTESLCTTITNSREALSLQFRL